MKRTISLLLTLLALSLIGVSVHAGGTSTSKVVYAGVRGEYTVTVPLELAYTPGGAPLQDEVVLSGQWPSNRIVSVSSDATAEVGSKTVNIRCAEISEAGSNTDRLSFRESFSTDGIGKTILDTTRRGVTNFTVSSTPAS